MFVKEQAPERAGENLSGRLFIDPTVTAYHPIESFAASAATMKDSREIASGIVSEVLKYVPVDYCAVYMRRQRSYHLTCLKSSILLKLPSKLSSHAELCSGVLREGILSGEKLPAVNGIAAGMAIALSLKGYSLGFVLLGRKRGEKDSPFSIEEREYLAALCHDFSLALLISYFEEYQRVTEEKFKLLIEKERLESASQMSELYRHELGNILSIISLAASTLAAEGDQEPSKKMRTMALTSIRDNIKRSQNIFSVITSYNEKVKSAYKLLSLDRIMNDIVEGYKASCAKQRVKVSLSIEPNLLVFGNENLKDACAYLVKGALHAFEHYDPEARELLVHVKKIGQTAAIEVADTGNDATLNTVYNGMSIERGKEGGLQYFIARKVAFDHQGAFEIASFRSGEGTACRMTIPLYEGVIENEFLFDR